MKCPTCNGENMQQIRQDEEFKFDIGFTVLTAYAKNVPVKKCLDCGEELSGPTASERRVTAMYVATVDAWRAEREHNNKQKEITQ